MSRFQVDLVGEGSGGSTRKRRRVLKAVLVSLAAVAVLVSLAGWMYWRSLRDTPQYSLALIIDAARSDDQATLNELVDIDAIADDFTPQVLGKAVEMYGRGLPPQVVTRLKAVADPLMPAVKDRARAAMPRLIRERVARFGSVPFAAMVLAADRYLDVETSGETSTVRSKLNDRPLEIRMRRTGDRWKIVGVKDDVLATEISRKIGQEIISIANDPNNRGPNRLGIGGLSDLLREAQEILQ